MTEVIETNLATKQDILDVKRDLNDLRVNLENKITQSEYRLTVKLGTIVSIAIGIAVTLAKLI